MRCRRIIDGNVVWFGKTGKESEKTSNYSDEQQAVVDSLTQRLSVIRKELWYAINEGLPLTDKASKIELDLSVMSIIDSHPDVLTVKDINSATKDGKYTCKVTVLSKFGQIDLSI